MDIPPDQPAPSKLPNRQRRKTRTALINAAQHLFAKNPVEGVTVDDIVVMADVAKGSFYNHFGDKKALADEVYGEIATEVEARINANNENIADPAFRIARALCTVMEYATTHPRQIQALLSLEDRRTNYVSHLNDGLANDVREGLETGRLGGVDIETGVLAVVGLVGVTIRSLISGNSVGPAQTLASHMAGCVLRALCVSASEATQLAELAASDIIRS